MDAARGGRRGHEAHAHRAQRHGQPLPPSGPAREDRRHRGPPLRWPARDGDRRRLERARVRHVRHAVPADCRGAHRPARRGLPGAEGALDRAADRDREALAARRLHRLPAVPGESPWCSRRPAGGHPDGCGPRSAAASAVVTVVGQRVRAIGWDARTSGTDAYSADLPFTDVLIGRILRSPHPYARVVSIDTARAARMPGVRAVITAADFPAGARYIHSGGETSDRGPLADGVVRYVGEEVAAVAADTEEQADAALAVIAVRYRPSKAPLTIDEALAPRARAIHTRKTGEPNVSLKSAGAWGDVEKGRREGTVVARGTYWYPRVAHAVMEQNIAIAKWDVETERFELWTSTQAPHFVVTELAHVFGLRRDQVVTREVAVGGGFGSKSKVSEHEALAAALARKSGRLVKIALSREEEFACTKPRHAFRTKLEARADAQGRIRFFEARIDVDNGAYNH